MVQWVGAGACTRMFQVGISVQVVFFSSFLEKNLVLLALGFRGFGSRVYKG